MLTPTLGRLSLLVWLPFCLFGQAGGPGPAKQGQAKGPTRTPVVNMQVLPRNVDLHIMELFRSALGVECNFCHVAGEEQEKGHNGDRQSDANPKKLIARDMIRMTKQINEALTGSGAYPEEKNVVTCWTCHRGNHIPRTAPPATKN